MTSSEMFFTAGGTLRPDALSYVERPADTQLRRLCREGQLCYVLSTRQMGKSSLMLKTEECLRAQGMHTAIVDLTSIGQVCEEEWFFSFLDILQLELSFSTDAEEWWEANHTLSHVRRFTKFVQEVLQSELKGPTVIFIDEVDNALNLPFADDFFAAIRAIHNWQARQPGPPKLSFVLLGVAMPTELIKDQRRTPFNVGENIQLDELTLTDAKPVFLRGIPNQNEILLERLFYWTGGHPYLTQKLGQAIAQKATPDWTAVHVDKLVETLFLSERAAIEDANLQFVAGRTLASPRQEQLLQLYNQILHGERVANDDNRRDHSELKLYGLLKANEKGNLVVRNRIYEAAFGKTWVEAFLPPKPYLQRTWVWVAIAVIVLLLGTIAALVLQQQRTTELLAQSYIDSFTSSTESQTQADALSSLAALSGYENEIVRLFYGLTFAEQIALLDAMPKTAVSEKIVSLVYTDLVTDDPAASQPSTEVLAAFVAMFARQDKEELGLSLEIQRWHNGRLQAVDKSYAAALKSYRDAIGIEHNNPATQYEYALVAILAGDSDAALGMLDGLMDNSEWEERAVKVIEGNPELQRLAQNNRTVRNQPTPEATVAERPNPPTQVVADNISATEPAAPALLASATPSFNGPAVQFIYDTKSFYLINLGTIPLEAERFAFAAVDENDNPAGYSFAGRGWTRFYPYIAPENCNAIEPVGYSDFRRPEQCTNQNALVTPSVDENTLFWVPRTNVTKFIVLWNGQVIGECTIEFESCRLRLPN